jgi:hypothetical protein
MKPKWIATISACVLAGAIALTSIEPAAAQNGRAAAPGTPPIGRRVEISLTTWVSGEKDANMRELKVTGILVAMTDRWVVVQDGSYEQWVPMDRVVVMQAAR